MPRASGAPAPRSPPPSAMPSAAEPVCDDCLPRGALPRRHRLWRHRRAGLVHHHRGAVHRRRAAQPELGQRQAPARRRAEGITPPGWLQQGLGFARFSPTPDRALANANTCAGRKAQESRRLPPCSRPTSKLCQPRKIASRVDQVFGSGPLSRAPACGPTRMRRTGSQGGLRTPKPFGAASTMRCVCQFRHLGSASSSEARAASPGSAKL